MRDRAQTGFPELYGGQTQDKVHAKDYVTADDETIYVLKRSEERLKNIGSRLVLQPKQFTNNSRKLTLFFSTMPVNYKELC